jgi:hypothetical protein
MENPMGEFPPELQRIFDEIHAQEGGRRPATLPEAYLKALEEIEKLPATRTARTSHGCCEPIASTAIPSATHDSWTEP